MIHQTGGLEASRADARGGDARACSCCEGAAAIARRDQSSGIIAQADGSTPTFSAGAHGLMLYTAWNCVSQHSVCIAPAPSPETTCTSDRPSPVPSQRLVMLNLSRPSGPGM